MDDSNTFSVVEYDDTGYMLRAASGMLTVDQALECYADSTHSLLVIEGDPPDILKRTHYILNGEPTERPASPVTRTDLTLHDVPNGATLWINGVSYDAEGEVELEFPLPGTYSLRVECFPFLDWTDEVVVP